MFGMLSYTLKKMDFDCTFDSLRPGDKQRASNWMRESFAPILTRWEPIEGGGKGILLLQLIDRKAQALLHHRLDFSSFSSDRLVLNHHLVIHRVNFIRKGVAGNREQVGDYVELVLGFSELWEIARQLEVPKSDVQILLMEEGVKKIMGLEEFRPFLPERLKKVNLFAISQMSEETVSDVSEKFFEDPMGRGERLDRLS
jgi:hypothetical protein